MGGVFDNVNIRMINDETVLAGHMLVLNSYVSNDAPNSVKISSIALRVGIMF